MSGEPLVLKPITIEVERSTLVLLELLRKHAAEEPADVVNVDEYHGSEHIGLACHQRMRWEQLRDGLTLAIGHSLVRQALEVVDA